MTTRKELVVGIKGRDDGATREMRSVGRAAGRLGDRVRREARGSERALERLSRAARAVRASIGLGVGFAAVGGAVGIGAGLTIGRRTLRSIDEARQNLDELGKSARQYDIAVERLSELSVAADRYGVSQREIATGLRTLQRNLGLLDVQGASPARDAMAALGIEVRDSEGALRSVDELLPEIADGLERLGGRETQGAVLSRLFGDRSGGQFLRLLDEGSAGLDDMAARAERLGVVFTKEQTDAAERLTDAWADVESGARGVSAELLVIWEESATPVLTGFANLLGDTATMLRELRSIELSPADERELSRLMMDAGMEFGGMMVDGAKAAGMVFTAVVAEGFVELATTVLPKAMAGAYAALRGTLISSTGFAYGVSRQVTVNQPGGFVMDRILPTRAQYEAFADSLLPSGAVVEGIARGVGATAGPAVRDALGLDSLSMIRAAGMLLGDAAQLRTNRLSRNIGQTMAGIRSRAEAEGRLISTPELDLGGPTMEFSPYDPALANLLSPRIQQQADALRALIEQRNLALVGDERAAERARLMAAQQGELTRAIESTTGAVPGLYQELQTLQTAELERFDIETRLLGITEAAEAAGARFRQGIAERAQLVQQGALTELNATRQTRGEQQRLAETLRESEAQVRAIAAAQPTAEWVEAYIERVRALRGELDSVPTGPEPFRDNFGDFIPGFRRGIRDASADVRDLETIGSQVGQTFATSASSGIAEFGITVAETSRLSADSFNEMATSIGKDIGQMMIQLAVLRGLGIVFGGLGGSTPVAPGAGGAFFLPPGLLGRHEGGGIPGYNLGGIHGLARFSRERMVLGSGPIDRDSRLAALTVGEGVLNRRATADMGHAELAARNRGSYRPGPFGGAASVYAPSVNLTVHVDGGQNEAQARRTGETVGREVVRVVLEELGRSSGARAAMREAIGP